MLRKNVVVEKQVSTPKNLYTKEYQNYHCDEKLRQSPKKSEAAMATTRSDRRSAKAQNYDNFSRLASEFDQTLLPLGMEARQKTKGAYKKF